MLLERLGSGSCPGKVSRLSSSLSNFFTISLYSLTLGSNGSKKELSLAIVLEDWTAIDISPCHATMGPTWADDLLPASYYLQSVDWTVGLKEKTGFNKVAALQSLASQFLLFTLIIITNRAL